MPKAPALQPELLAFGRVPPSGVPRLEQAACEERSWSNKREFAAADRRANFPVFRAPVLPLSAKIQRISGRVSH
jgi:hypothetical protein